MTPPPLSGLQSRFYNPYQQPVQSGRSAPKPTRASISIPAESPPETLTRLYNYIGPLQAVTLFTAGIAASVGVRWILAGAKSQLPKSLTKAPTSSPDPMSHLSRQAAQGKIEDQTAVYFTEGLPSVLMFALKHPGAVQDRLKAYLAAMGLGYAAGSVADGVQEVWIRREETQVRANLLQQLTGQYRQSIQLKAQMDEALREKAKREITELLTQCNIPAPEALLKPLPQSQQDALYRYPYEPYHFSKPVSAGTSNTPQTLSAFRFGEQAQAQTSSFQTVPDTANTFNPSNDGLKFLKAGIFGLGSLTGFLGQGVLSMMQRAGQAQSLNQIAGSTKTFYRIFNVANTEALFLTGNGRMLLTMLGITALARVGKMLIDGYREIEVTRHNAATELRYQSYNWLGLDPRFHQIAEEEAYQDAMRQMRQAIPYEWQNRKMLSDRIQTILSNIGRNSAPKYFQMTPPVNLVNARG